MNHNTESAPTPRTKRHAIGYVGTAIVALLVGAGAVAVPSVAASQAQAEQLAAADASIEAAEADLEAAQDAADDARLAYAQSLCEEAAARQVPGGVQIEWPESLTWPESDGERRLGSPAIVLDEAGAEQYRAEIECHLDDADGQLAVNAFAVWEEQ